MNGNINRNSLDHTETGTRVLNHSKSFQDRAMKRYKSRNTQLNDNGDFRNSRNNNIKKSYKSYDDHLSFDTDVIKSNHERPDNKPETFSNRCFNGDRMSKNAAYASDRKPLLNTPMNEYPKPVVDESKRNLRQKEVRGVMPERYKPREQSNIAKETNNNNINCQRDRTTVKLKLNFLQESQLNNDKFEASSDHSKDTSVATNSSSQSLKPSNNGLNPAALEFTPSSTVQQTIEVINNGIKSLSLTVDNGYPSNAFDGVAATATVDYNYMNHQPLAVFGDQSYSSGKLGFVDPSMVHNVLYQCQPPPPQNNRPLSRLSYQQPAMMAPQFQVALYGPNPHLIRYNSIQNVAAAGNYIVCNPVMFNSLYGNSQCPGPNRLVQLTANDIPVGSMSSQSPSLSSNHNIAHQFNPNLSHGNYPSYYTAESVNSALSHIR